MYSVPEYKFEIGQMVLVRYDGKPHYIDTVKSISPKRGEITLTKSKNKYNSRGSQNGEWSKGNIEPLTAENKAQFYSNVHRSFLKNLDWSTIPDAEIDIIYNMLKTMQGASDV